MEQKRQRLRLNSWYTRRPNLVSDTPPHHHSLPREKERNSPIDVLIDLREMILNLPAIGKRIYIPSKSPTTCKGWNLEDLLSRSNNFCPIPRMYYTSPQLAEQLHEYEKNGIPLVIEGYHDHPNWPTDMFNVDWLCKHGPESINARNIHSRTDRSLLIREFFQRLRETPPYATKETERLYGKDAECPVPWNEWLHNSSVLPSTLLPNGPDNYMLNLPKSAQVETLMCYLGIGDTFTPSHKDLCASSGQNLMCYTENDGSSFWFMTESSAAPEVVEYFHRINEEIDHETHVVSINEWAKAPFKVYITEQKVGDLVLVPPRSCHQVVNHGGITIKTSWSRMTLNNLKTALYHELPIYQRVCRVETYRIKSTIHHALLRRNSQLESLLMNDNSSSPLPGVRPENYQLLANELDELVALFDWILSEEYADHPVQLISSSSDPAHRYDQADGFLTCDFCGADIFESFLECRTCVTTPSSDGAVGNGFVICPGCYTEGRSCRCENMVPTQCFLFDDLIEDHDKAIQLLHRCSALSGITINRSTNATRSTWKADPETVGLFRAACNLYDIRNRLKEGSVRKCSPRKSESPHMQDAASTVYCGKCHYTKCFAHLLSDNCLHSAEILQFYATKGVSPSSYHSRHQGASLRYQEVMDSVMYEKDGFDPAPLRLQRVRHALTYQTCKPINTNFIKPGWYDNTIHFSQENPEHASDEASKEAPCSSFVTTTSTSLPSLDSAASSLMLKNPSDEASKDVPSSLPKISISAACLPRSPAAMLAQPLDDCPSPLTEISTDNEEEATHTPSAPLSPLIHVPDKRKQQRMIVEVVLPPRPICKYHQICVSDNHDSSTSDHRGQLRADSLKVAVAGDAVKRKKLAEVHVQPPSTTYSATTQTHDRSGAPQPSRQQTKERTFKKSRFTELPSTGGDPLSLSIDSPGTIVPYKQKVPSTFHPLKIGPPKKRRVETRDRDAQHSGNLVSQHRKSIQQESTIHGQTVLELSPNGITRGMKRHSDAQPLDEGNHVSSRSHQKSNDLPLSPSKDRPFKKQRSDVVPSSCVPSSSRMSSGSTAQPQKKPKRPSTFTSQPICGNLGEETLVSAYNTANAHNSGSRRDCWPASSIQSTRRISTPTTPAMTPRSIVTPSSTTRLTLPTATPVDDVPALHRDRAVTAASLECLPHHEFSTDEPINLGPTSVPHVVNTADSVDGPNVSGPSSHGTSDAIPVATELLQQLQQTQAQLEQARADLNHLKSQLPNSSPDPNVCLQILANNMLFYMGSALCTLPASSQPQVDPHWPRSQSRGPPVHQERRPPSDVREGPSFSRHPRLYTHGEVDHRNGPRLSNTSRNALSHYDGEYFRKKYEPPSEPRHHGPYERSHRFYGDGYRGRGKPHRHGKPYYYQGNRPGRYYRSSLMQRLDPNPRQHQHSYDNRAPDFHSPRVSEFTTGSSEAYEQVAPQDPVSHDKAGHQVHDSRMRPPRSPVLPSPLSQSIPLATFQTQRQLDSPRHPPSPTSTFRLPSVAPSAEPSQWEDDYVQEDDMVSTPVHHLRLSSKATGSSGGVLPNSVIGEEDDLTVNHWVNHLPEGTPKL